MKNKILEFYLKENNLFMWELAVICRVSVTAIRKIASQDPHIRYKTVRIVAEIIGVEVSALMDVP